jgi:hypothetical protein
MVCVRGKIDNIPYIKVEIIGYIGYIGNKFY